MSTYICVYTYIYIYIYIHTYTYTTAQATNSSSPFKLGQCHTTDREVPGQAVTTLWYTIIWYNNIYTHVCIYICYYYCYYDIADQNPQARRSVGRRRRKLWRRSKDNSEEFPESGTLFGHPSMLILRWAPLNAHVYLDSGHVYITIKTKRDPVHSFAKHMFITCTTAREIPVQMSAPRLQLWISNNRFVNDNCISCCWSETQQVV